MSVQQWQLYLQIKADSPVFFEIKLKIQIKESIIKPLECEKSKSCY